MGGLKKNRLLKGTCPPSGEWTPLLLKKSTIFRKNVKNTRHTLKNVFIKALFLYCYPCPQYLSTGSKEIFIICPLKELRGGGWSELSGNFP